MEKHRRKSFHKRNKKLSFSNNKTSRDIRTHHSTAKKHRRKFGEFSFESISNEPYIIDRTAISQSGSHSKCTPIINWRTQSPIKGEQIKCPVIYFRFLFLHHFTLRIFTFAHFLLNPFFAKSHIKTESNIMSIRC